MKVFYFLLLIASSFSQAQSWKSQIIKDAVNLYGPVAVQNFNKPIYFKVNDEESVSASADHTSYSLSVIINKGVLSSPRLSPDGLRMVICHELGHLFGGAPRRNIPMEWDGPVADDGRSFMSSEGQADYYASLVCFRKMLLEQRGEEPKPDFLRVGPKLKAKCEVTAGLRGEDLQICLRTGLAGEDFLKLVFEFPISCEKEDTSITPELLRDSYPGRQCRLDTIVNGALCGDVQPMVLDFNIQSQNTCGSVHAARPGCWYR